MLVQILTWLLVALLFLLGSLLRPRATRIAVGLFFIVMAFGVNLVLTVSAPEQFVSLGADSPLPFYRLLFRDIVAPNPALLGLCGVVYETIVGVAILARGRAVRWGLLGGILFLLVITPLNPATYPNPLFAAALAVLLRHRYDTKGSGFGSQGSGKRKEIEIINERRAASADGNALPRPPIPDP